MARIPSNAFEQYLALGDRRSYALLAQQIGVSKRCITKRATRERWQERAASIQVQAATRTDAKAVESIHEMNERHLKTLKLVQARAIEALRSMPLTTAIAAVRALDVAIRGERLIRGEPNYVSREIEEQFRYEERRWLRPVARPADATVTSAGRAESAAALSDGHGGGEDSASTFDARP